MWRFWPRIIRAIAITVMLSLTQSSGIAQTSVSCEVPFSYIEAVQENTHSLLKTLDMSTAAESPLQDAEIVVVYAAMLISTRNYHEEVHNTLPACAQSFNRVMIETISATQDVLTFFLALNTDENNLRYTGYLEQTQDGLRLRWEALLTQMRTTALLVEK